MKHIRTTENFAAAFAPQMLFEDANAIAHEISWLPAALCNCGPGQWESRAYVRYISRVHANQPGSEWQYTGSVTLHHRDFGMVVIDLLEGKRIGGIEFVDLLE